MKTNHSPLPWVATVRKDGLGRSPTGDSIEIVHNYPQGGQQVIVGKHTGIDCLNEPNATLICRAVNSHYQLVEALEAVSDDFQEVGCSGLGTITQETFEKAQAALELAKKGIVV